MKEIIQQTLSYISASKTRKLITALVIAIGVIPLMAVVSNDRTRSRNNSQLMKNIKANRVRNLLLQRQTGAAQHQQQAQRQQAQQPQLQLANDKAPAYGTIPDFGTYYYASPDGKDIVYVHLNTNVYPALWGGMVEKHTIFFAFNGKVNYNYLCNISDLQDMKDSWAAFPGWNTVSGITISLDKGWRTVIFGSNSGPVYYSLRITGYQYEQLKKTISAPARGGAAGAYVPSDDDNSSSTNKDTYLKKTPKDHYIPCPSHCVAGNCRSCGGTGTKVDRVWDGDLGRYSEVPGVCPICGGTGKCGTCHGYGKIVNY